MNYRDVWNQADFDRKEREWERLKEREYDENQWEDEKENDWEDEE